MFAYIYEVWNDGFSEPIFLKKSAVRSVRMRVLVLPLILAMANAAPQFPLDAGFQNSPQFIRAYILPVVPQIENRQLLHPGAQIFLLHPFQQQNQLSFVQDQPQGQLFYIQGAPQLFNPQAETNSVPVKETPNPYTQSNPQKPFYEPSKPKVTSGSTYQKTRPVSSYQTHESDSQKSAGSPLGPSTYHGTPNGGALRKSSSQGSYSGYPQQPGQGGVDGYVTLRQSQDDNFDGNFQYNYETDHGIVVDVVGSVKNQGAEDQIQVIQGSYSYKNPDGTVITTTYIADENGFVAQGDHLPTPGPLPEAIAKSLAYIASQPSTEERK